MDKNKFWLGGRLFNTSATHVRKLGGPTHVRNARHVRNANARQGTSANARHVRKRKRMARPQRKAHPQLGRPNATQGTSARWSPKRKTHPQRKRPHKGALGQKTRWRMDKNKFWLGGRIFNTASRHVRKLGGPTHVRNANARHVHNARHVRKLAAPTKPKAHPQDGRPNAKLIRNENVYTREH